MTANRKVTGKALSIPGGLMVGTCVSLGLTLLFSGILAKLVSAEKLPWEQIGYGIMALLFLSALSGAASAATAVKHRRLAVCLMAGALYWIALLAITALFFGGQYHGLGVTALIIFAGCGTVCLLEMRRGEGKKSSLRRKKYH